MPIAITFSFDDNTRHKAFAILNGGDGFGGVICPIVFSYLIEYFSWRNTLLIVAGMAANLAVSGCTVPLSLHTTNVPVNTKVRKLTSVLLSRMSFSDPSTGKPVPDEQPLAVTNTTDTLQNLEDGENNEDQSCVPAGVFKLDPVTNQLEPLDQALKNERKFASAETSPTSNVMETAGHSKNNADQILMPGELGTSFQEPAVRLFPNLLFFYTNIVTHSIGYFIFMTFVFSDMKEQKIASSTVSSIVAVIGGVSILGRVSIGVMDNKRVPRWVIYMVGHLIRSVVVLFFTIDLATSPSGKVVKYTILCAMYGLSDGVTGSLIPLVCVDLFGLEKFGTVLGWEMFLMGLGAFIGVPLGGKFSNHTYLIIMHNIVLFLQELCEMLPTATIYLSCFLLSCSCLLV